MDLSSIMAAVAATAALLALYAWRLNRIMYAVPEDALKCSPRRWTDSELRETYERVCREPVDYGKVTPPKLERRYIIVGGSGLVGGNIVLQLLQRGQPASAIRIVDFAAPYRAEFLEKNIDFVQTDISDAASTTAAFTKPWPASVAPLPLTVFHTAAIIRPWERTLATWPRTEPVNVTGTRNSLAAARTAAASVYIFTSSASVAARPCAFLATPPWAAHPRAALQLLDERDFDAPVVRPRDEFFANYAYAKALSERLVAEANGVGGLRTGCLRPGGGIYGLPRDLVMCEFLRKGRNTGFAPQTIQSLVSAWNVSLAQLQFEAALVGGGGGSRETKMPACAGRPFVVTDPGPPPTWRDWYRAAETLSVTPTEVLILPPLVLYLMAVAIEAWISLLMRFPVLKQLGLREPTGDLVSLQPAIFSAMVYVICVDDQARKSVEDGGFGYRGGVTTLEGVCELIRDWNRSREKLGHGGEKGDKSTSMLDTGVVATKAA
ncbi:unnamed protein product [Discula destructiva]